MSDGLRQASLVVGAAATVVEAAVLLFHESGVQAIVGIWPVPVVGTLALGIAVRNGASRWLIAAIPLMLLPLAPWGLLWAACEFGRDCV